MVSFEELPEDLQSVLRQYRGAEGHGEENQLESSDAVSQCGNFLDKRSDSSDTDIDDFPRIFDDRTNVKSDLHRLLYPNRGSMELHEDLQPLPQERCRMRG